jgi:hypothetical protein
MRVAALWAVLVALWVAFLVWDDSSGKSAPAAAALATAEWRAPQTGSPIAVNEMMDLASCQAAQRRLAAARDRGGRVTLSCKGPL